METIGIIGYGRFGDNLYKAFKNYSKDYLVKVYSRSNAADNTKFFKLKDVCACDIIIPTVPISAFEEQIKSICNLINTKSLVIDVCSVSIFPAEVMKKYFSESIDLLSTHPMFGPDSTKDATFYKDLEFIYFPLRIKNTERYVNFLKFWKDLGCEMIELSPEEHDKQAAYTHAFAFLIGKIGMKLKVRRNSISTKGFEGILYNQTAVENDTGQLFNDMMTYNPYCKEMLEKVEKALLEINKELEK